MAHWKQLNWNLYRLTVDEAVHDFPSFRRLHDFCVQRDINATQA